MFFSRSAEYGIKAVLFLASNHQQGKRYGIKTIANSLLLPEPFMGKVLQSLARKGKIGSIKGPNGGFFLRAEDFKRPLIEIVDAIDGLEAFRKCAIGLNQCSDEHPCPIHNDYGPVRDKLYNSLVTNTIADFSLDIEQNRSFLSL